MTNREIGFLWLFKEKCNFGAMPVDADFSGYMKAVLICANGDGKLSPAERDWVVGQTAAFGAPDSIVDELKTYKADEDIEEIISASPGANASRYYMVYDAIRACCADGEYSAPERATVTRMAAKLGISDELVKQIEEVCFEEILLREKRLKLLYPVGTPL